MSIKQKKYLNSWSNFEIFLLLSSIYFIIILGFVVKSNLLAISVAFLGVFSSLNRAKGKVLSQTTGIILSILYSIIAFQNKYYGEVIIYLFIMLPIYISSVYTWLKYKNNKTNEVLQNNISKKTTLLLFIINFCLFFLLYFILKIFNTNQLLLSTFSMLVKLNAAYLALKRNKYSFIFYTISAIMLLMLWGIPIFNGQYELLPMLFDSILLIINNIYGFVKWSKNK